MTRSLTTNKAAIRSKSPLLASSALVKPMLTMAALGAMSTMATSAAKAQAIGVDPLATPYGEQVVGGSATFDRPQLGELNVDQTTDRAVINWERFDIGENATTTFYVPNSGSMTVNRVTGAHSDSTQILGTLRSFSKASGGIGGTQILLDRNGIIFGPNSQVDVGSLIASTGNLDDTRFMAGDTRLEFSDFGDGAIINHGTITVADAGMAAFVSKHAANHGTINARVGKVAFAAGEKVTIDFYGDRLVEIALDGDVEAALLENTGTINAEGGIVQIEARAARALVDNVINMAGVVNASSFEAKGGKIILNGGDAGKVAVSGTLDASAKDDNQDGGEIDIDGFDVDITDTAVLAADGHGTGKGGDISLWADNRLYSAGSYTAKGTNGRVGTSGLTLHITDDTNVAADLWVIDPLSILIAQTAVASQSFIDVDTISAALSAGTSVRVETGIASAASAGGNNDGDITLKGFIDNNGGTATLELVALDDVIIGSVGGAAGIGGTGTTNVYLEAKGDDVTIINSIDTNGGTLTVNAADRSYVSLSGDVETNGGLITFNGVAGGNGIAGRVDAGTGDIDFKGNGGSYLYANSSVSGNEIDFTGTYARQQQGSTLEAGTITASLEQNIDLSSTLNDLNDIGDVTTGLSSNGGAKFYDREGDLTITGDVTSQGGAISFGHDGAIWSDNIHLGYNASVTSNNGAITFDSTSNVTMNGSVDAGSGTLNVTSKAWQLWGNTDIAARSIVVNSSSVRQWAGSKIDAQRLSGSVLTTVDFGSLNNEIDQLWGFDTGVANWHDGGFTLYTKSPLYVSGAVTTTGGDVSITSDSRVDFRVGSGVSAGAGNIFVGADLVNLWEDLDTTGTVSGTARTVHVRSDNAEIQDGVDLSLSGANIYVAEGDFYEDVTISGKNIWLQGLRRGDDARGRTGSETTIHGSVSLEFVTGGALRGFTISGGETGVSLNSANGISISNNVIKDQSASGLGDNGIYVRNSSNVLISRNDISGTGSNGIHARGIVGGLRITQNDVENTSRAAIDIYNTRGSVTVDNNDISGGASHGVAVRYANGIIVRDNDITNVGGDGVYVGENAQGAQILRNTITGGTDGIDIEGGDSHFVNSNIISSTSDNGIELSGSQHTRINGNTITDAGTDGINISNSHHVSVIRNTVTDADEDGVSVSGGSYVNVGAGNVVSGGKTGLRAENTSYLTVASSSFTGQTGSGSNGVGDGVNLDNADYARVLNNIITAAGDDGVDVENGSLNVRIQGNTIEKASDSGITIRSNSDNATVHDNTVDGAKNGVRVYGGADDSSITNNTISNVAQKGITVEANGLRVNGNTVSTNGDDAIEVSNSADIRVLNNTITSAGGEGIDVNNSARARIQENTVSSTGGNGISINPSPSSIISGNTVTAAGGHGIDVSGSDNTLIYDNEVYNATLNAVNVTASSNIDIRDNYINGGKASGIVLSGGTNNEIFENQVYGVSGNGIDASSSAGIEIYDNGVYGAGQNGVDVSASSGAIVDNNTVDGAGAHGISVSASQGAFIEENNIDGAGANGINVSSSSDVFVGYNTVLFSAGNGIALSGGIDNDVYQNIIGLAGKNGIYAELNDGLTIEDNIAGIVFGDAIHVANSSDTGIYGNLVGLAYGDGIALSGASGVSAVEDNKVLLTAGNGISSVKGSGEIVVKRNQVVLTGEHGIYVDGGRLVRIADNDIAYAGLGIYDWIDGLIAEGFGALFDNDFSVRTPKLAPEGIAVPWGSGDGIHVENVNGGRKGSDNVRIINNRIGLVGGDGIEVDDSGKTIISDNIIRGTGFDWTFYSNSDLSDHFSGIDIFDDVFTPGGEALLGDGNLTEFVYKLLPKPSDVEWDSRGGHGIYVHDADSRSVVSILDNDVRRTANDGISVDGYDWVEIDGNTVGYAGDEGIDVDDAKGVRVTDNNVTKTGDDGIEVKKVSGYIKGDWHVVIADNTVDEAGDDGIDVEKSGRVLITENTVSNSDDDGVDVDFVSRLDVRDNTVIASGDDGIDVEKSGRVLITENTISNSDDDGVDVDIVIHLDVRDNTVSASGDDGIDVHKSTGAWIEDNTVTDSGDNGIELSGSSHVDIENNRVMFSADNGISVSGGHANSINDNLVALAGENGIFAEYSYGLEIFDNIAGIVLGDAIHVEKSGDAYIYDNLVGLAYGDGISVSGAYDGLEISGNKVALVGGNGVSSTRGSGYINIHDNEIALTGGHGIYVNGGRVAHIIDNDVTYAGLGFYDWIDGFISEGFGALSDLSPRIRTPKLTPDGIAVPWGNGDGIHVENVSGRTRAANNVYISGNRVGLVGGDGIEVAYSGQTSVKGNKIRGAGLDWSFYDFDDLSDHFSDVDLYDDVLIAGGDALLGDANLAEFVYGLLPMPSNVKWDARGGNGIYVHNSIDGAGAEISGNMVSRTAQDGINVSYYGAVDVSENIVRFSGDDGVAIRNIRGGFGGNEYAVWVSGNTITTTGDDGVEVIDSGRTRIEGNVISDIGVSDENGDFYGADAIHVRNVENSYYGPKGPRGPIGPAAAQLDGPVKRPVEFGNAVEIVGNTVSTTGDDGVQVLFSGDTLVSGNNISNIGTPSGSRMFGADAVSIVTDGWFGPEAYMYGPSVNVEVSDNVISNVQGDGIEIDGANNVLVDGNTLSDIGDDAIRVTGYNGYFDFIGRPERPEFDGDQLQLASVQQKGLPFFIGEPPEFNAIISNNIVTNAGGDGIETTNLTMAEITGNDITGAAFNGYYASGPFNGQVIVSDNLFVDNEIGAHFESGEIDLTGEGNGFIGGGIGMRFAPYDFSQLAVEEKGARVKRGFGNWHVASRNFPVEGFADMSLVDNTIGSQLFSGQESFFVELDNGAFFDPGTPTILNALDSTYDIPGSGLVTPSATGGVITLDQFNFLESKFFHFTDDASLGLFFFGFVPGIDQEDIFRALAGFDPDAFDVRLTVLGLPRVGALGAGGPAGFSPEFLSQITPAAGGDDGGAGAPSVADLAAIDPAAGGEETSCQAAAFSSAEIGTAVTYSFGSSLDEGALDNAIDCGI